MLNSVTRQTRSAKPRKTTRKGPIDQSIGITCQRREDRGGASDSVDAANIDGSASAWGALLQSRRRMTGPGTCQNGQANPTQSTIGALTAQAAGSPYSEPALVQEDVVQDEVVQDDVVQDEVVQEDVVHEEVVQEDVVQDDVVGRTVLSREVMKVGMFR